MELTPEQWSTVTVVYTSALVPTVVLAILYLLGRVPGWVSRLWLASLVACALGWELWFTYGWVDGMDVDARRPQALQQAIPIHINWLVNSLVDAWICLVGTFLVWLAGGCTSRHFRRWHWGAFAVLAAWFIGQNLWVELTIYHTQLAAGLALSWAPLAPTGPWFNPAIAVGGASVQLQTQLPWLLMTPLFYGLLLRLYRRYASDESLST